LLDAEETGNAALIGDAVDRLRVSTSPFPGLLSLKELEDRRMRFAGQEKAAREAAWREMLAALPKASKPQDLSELVSRLRRLADENSGRSYGPDRTDPRMTAGAHIAEEWQKMLALGSAGEWQKAVEKGGEINQSIADKAPDLTEALQSHLAELRRKQLEAESSRREAVAKKLSEGLAASSTRAGLARFRKELDEDTSLRQGDDARDLSELRNDLASLGSLWDEAESGRSRPLREFDFTRQFQHPWTKQTSALREHIEHVLLANRLEDPKILQPPLDTVPAAELGARLVGAAADRGDWKQAYHLMQSLPQAGGDDSRDSEMMAVRNYLAGQNFENAELWPDAIECYKAVLRSTGKWIPVTAASDRLKALKKEHPDSFKNTP
jgi:hypothetical protein